MFADFEEENKTYWTKRAPSYSEVNQDELRTTQHAVWGDLLHRYIAKRHDGKEKQAIRVLDAGTGPGFFAIVLAERGYAVTAVDYTQSMLDEAKKNACHVKDAISFQQMNVENLSFDDNVFDVVVSRNVTWNLPHPERAYGEWCRVLKPGGVLLNFDANWYRYLYDEEAHMGYVADRREIIKKGVVNETDGTDIPAMEAIARKVPLSSSMRPYWDQSVLQQLGMKTVVDRDIWKTVWTRTERINNASTPMFLIEAIKSVVSA